MIDVAVYVTNEWITQDDLDRLNDAPAGTRVATCRSEEEFLDALEASQVAFISNWPESMESVPPGLRWVQVTSSGMDHHELMLEQLPPDVIVTNCRGVHATTMAHYVLMMIAACAWHLPDLLDQQRRRVWARWPVRPLEDLTVGIVGYGAIGRRIGRVLQVLNIRVEAIRAHPVAESSIPTFPPERLTSLLPSWDFVVLSAPLTDATRHMISTQQLEAMRPRTWIINVGRGGLIDNDALARALRRDLIGGAVLDVLNEEPLTPGSDLWDLPNCIITPHISGFREDLGAKVVDVFRRNLDAYRSGKTIENRVPRVRDDGQAR